MPRASCKGWESLTTCKQDKSNGPSPKRVSTFLSGPEDIIMIMISAQFPAQFQTTPAMELRLSVLRNIMTFTYNKYVTRDRDAKRAIQL